MANGFMEGALQGFNAVNDYYRGQKADERADRELGLRDAMWQNTLEQQQKLDARYTDELQYKRGRDVKDDERQAKIDALNEKSTLASINNAYASNRRADRQLALQEQQAKLLQEQNDRTRFQQENMPLFQVGYQALASGQEPPSAFWDAAKDPRAGQYNPERYITKDYANAGATFVQSTAPLMQDAQSGKLDWNSKEGIERINSPSIIKSAGVLYQDEIKTGIGGVDQATGKVIKNKELDKIMVTPDGTGVVLGLKVTYDDGSTADRPVTQNRSSDPNDAPKVIPVMDFVGTGYKRATMSKQMQQQAGLVSQALGLSEGPDNKGYRQAVVKVQAEMNKNISAIMRDTTTDNKDEAVAAERAAAEEQIANLRDVFGLDSKTKATAEAPSGNTVASWAGNDQGKRTFLEEAAKMGRSITEGTPPSVLESTYQAWVKAKQDDNTQKELRLMNGSNTSQPAPNAPRAAELKSLNEVYQAQQGNAGNASREANALQAMYGGVPLPTR